MIKEKELLDLENSFAVLEKLPIGEYILIPINADIRNFKSKIEKLNFPVWLKLSTPEHKARINAIKRCTSFEELKKTHEKFKKKFPGKKFIVQENLEGVEILAGIKEDQTFGKVLLLGAGGTLTEIIRDIEFRTLPVTKEEIRHALENLKIFEILKQRKYKISRLIGLIKRFSDMDIREADLNPIIINEKQAKILDARVSI